MIQFKFANVTLGVVRIELVIAVSSGIVASWPRLIRLPKKHFQWDLLLLFEIPSNL